MPDETVKMEMEEPDHGTSLLEALKNFVMGKKGKGGLGNMGQSKAKREAEAELRRQYAMDEGKEPEE